VIKRLLVRILDKFGMVLISKERYMGLVMTKAREWPNQAAETRDEAAEDAIKIERISTTALTSHLSPEENMRSWGLVAKISQHILRLLESVGSRTRP
jgi:hypothetical protein